LIKIYFGERSMKDLKKVFIVRVDNSVHVKIPIESLEVAETDFLLVKVQKLFVESDIKEELGKLMVVE